MYEAITIPVPTASPCSQVPYPDAASMACPKVCPRFKVARTPPSLSSAATTSALLAQLLWMAYLNASGSLSNSFSILSSSHTKRSASRIKPYLIISEMPDASSLSGRVLSDVVSINTHRGW
eukprot:jgi/Picsp_1/3945/NSC_01457-R1_---NA---